MKAMQALPEMPMLADADLTPTNPRLLEALANLNQISTAINRFSSSGNVHRAENAAEEVGATLLLIAESATRVVPGASAVIYTYDQREHSFDIASRVSAGEHGASVHDAPRVEGIGMRAIRQRRRVISYEENDLNIHPAKVRAGAKAMACFPLIVANQAVGVLYVYLHEARHFSQVELLLLDNFVNQAAMAIYQARRLANVQRDLKRKEEELTRLRRAGLLISSRLGLQETLEAILQMAMDVTGALYGNFRLVDASGSNLVTHVRMGPHLMHPHDEVLPINAQSIMGWVAEHRLPLCIHDVNSAPWNRIYYPLDGGVRMRSELAVPLIGSNGRLEGVLNLESQIIGAFSEDDSLLLQSLATQAVTAIQEARLLNALLEVAELLLIQPTQQVLTHLSATACDLLDAVDSAIWTLEGECLVLQVASRGYKVGETLPLQGSLAGQAILSADMVVSEDVSVDARFHQADLAKLHNWGRALVVPLLSQEKREPIGAFSVYRARSAPGRLTESEWDEKILMCLGHYAALALHNAARQRALNTARERHAVAETFAAVGDVAANVLHHLNNKVGTIPVRIQGIQDKCQTSLAEDTYLAANLMEIEQSAREAMQAVRDNLAHLRPIHPAPVNVAACVDAAVKIAGLSDTLHIQIDADLVDLPPVLAAQQGLTLIFANLLDNASHAMQGHGKIVIWGSIDGHWVEVGVSDNGPGISPTLHSQIFEFSFSGRTSKRNGKLGFGLWWVKTLLVRLGGSIAVESDGQSGTTFILRLPVETGELSS